MASVHEERQEIENRVQNAAIQIQSVARMFIQRLTYKKLLAERRKVVVQ